MPQKLTPEQLEEASSNLKEEMLPTLHGAEHYFALVKHRNQLILCILDDGKWRPTTQDEMMGLL